MLRRIKIITIFICPILLFIGTQKVCAQATLQVTTDSFVIRTDLVATVNDDEKMFSVDERNKLANVLDSFEKQSGITIALFTIRPTLINSYNFDRYVIELSNNMNNDDAVVIGISKQYKRIRITNGSDIGQFLSNDKTKQIVDNYFIPNYKKEDYFSGTLIGIYRLIDALQSYKMTY